MNEPRTEAGQRLVKRLYEYDADDHPNASGTIKRAAGPMILDIERQSRATALADLAERVRGLLTPGNEHGLTYQAGRNDGLRKAIALIEAPEEAS